MGHFNWPLTAFNHPVRGLQHSAKTLVTPAGLEFLRKEFAIAASRGGTQKSLWLVSAQDLANHIDEQRTKSRREWAKVNVA